MAKQGSGVAFDSAAVEKINGGLHLTLMGRPMRTPKGNPFVVPNDALGEAVAQEWRSLEGSKVRYDLLPLSRLCFSAIDLVPGAREETMGQLLGYLDTDLVFFRVAEPDSLREMQDAHLTPICEWISQTCGCAVVLTDSLHPVVQEAELAETLKEKVQALSAFQLAAVDLTTRLSGSLCIAAAVLHEAISADEAWQASRVDEEWQIKRWGRDLDAERRVDAQKKDFLSATEVLHLLRL